MFVDTNGFRVADLTCPVHGVTGTDPGDGQWELVGGMMIGKHRADMEPNEQATTYKPKHRKPKHRKG